MITPLQTFRDIHKDKMAFLLGTGVSLDSVDVEKLRPYITMGVNGSLFKISDPDYFFTADGGVFRYGLLTIISKNTHIILSNELDFSDEGIDVVMKSFELTKYSNVRRKFNTKAPESCTMRTTDEALVFGLSSVHPAAHLLYIMGCNPIVLLGCECKFTDEVYSFYMLPKYKHLLTKSFINNEGNPDLPLPEGKHKEILRKDLPGHLSAFHKYWDKMKELAPNVPIIDACDSAMVDYPKMTLEEVLQKYSSRTKE